MTRRLAFKVLTAAQFAELQADRFAGAAIDVADGFIHLSTAAQLTETVQKHFTGAEGLVVAAVDLTLLGDALRWEPSRGGALFPHVYGALRMVHVVAHEPLRWRDGEVVLPGTDNGI